jgi:putative phosphoribosyl transferase
MRIFRDRQDAGAQLALGLQGYAERPDVLVLALPRGGVPIGYELATRLQVPLDVLVVRKLGVPGHSELAMGAIASGGVQVIDRQIMSALGISREAFDAVVASERAELERREQLFRGNRASLDVRDKTVILVDDGLATGATMKAAIEALRLRRPAAIAVAVPIASAETCAALRPLVDDMICLVTPRHFHAVGLWYRDFSQTADSEVRALLGAAERALESGVAATPSAGTPAAH